MKKIVIYCNNKSCPFSDCECRVDRIKSEARRAEVTQIDMQCTCQRYTEYLAEQINKILRK